MTQEEIITFLQREDVNKAAIAKILRWPQPTYLYHLAMRNHRMREETREAIAAAIGKYVKAERARFE